MRAIIPLSSAPLFVFVLCSCCQLKPGDYRFQATIQDQAIAYRQGAQKPENLVLLIKLQNLGTNSIRLAPRKPAAGNGLKVHAELLDKTQPFELLDSQLEPGFKGGLCLEEFSNGNRISIFDRHDSAVRKLAESSSRLFKHDSDAYRTSLHVNANEAFLFLTLKVKWDVVDKTVPCARYDIPIGLTFSYVDREGKVLNHSGKLEHVATVNLLNSRRYPTFLPVVGGPASGTFK